MEKTPWRSRLFLRYLLYQIPGWALWSAMLTLLRPWFEFPWWIIPAVLIGWALKDLVMFPFVWRAYDPNPPERRPGAGSLGIVVKALCPEGYVRIQGELWQAETAKENISIPAGIPVEVKGVRGLTLLVLPLPKEGEA